LENKERKNILREVNVKTIFKIMVKREIKMLASEAVWPRVFPWLERKNDNGET